MNRRSGRFRFGLTGVNKRPEDFFHDLPGPVLPTVDNMSAMTKQSPSHTATQARELALKLLYLLDATDARTVERQMPELLGSETDSRSAREGAMELYRGVAASLGEIDGKIAETALNWQLSRMPYIDRAILRLGVYELLYAHDVPPKVSINEAVDLAKRYSTEKSGAFVNGVLDKVFQTYCPEKV